MSQRLRFALAAFATLVVTAFTVFAAPTFPPLTGRVVDQAAVLDPASEVRLESKLADLESKTQTQLVVVTLTSLQGYDIADYGYQLGRAWGIGQKGKNNGALLIVASTDRKVRIEVGYGLEGDLTDAVTRLIIANSILPRFRTGDFAGGIERGVQDIVQVLSGDAEDFKRRASDGNRRASNSENVGSFTLVIVILLAWWIFSRMFRGRNSVRSRRAGWWGPPVIGGGWPGGGWSSGGSSGGGSSGGGGFSGGGGSFGGGGSSGSW